MGNWPEWRTPKNCRATEPKRDRLPGLDHTPKDFPPSADQPTVTGMPSIETKHFGAISYNPDVVVEFPKGLPGFENRRRFVALNFNDTQPLIFLQSLED